MTMLPWKLPVRQEHDIAEAFSIPDGWLLDKRTEDIHDRASNKITDWVIAPIAPAPWECGQVITRRGWIYTFQPDLRRYR